jgi:hypothetical protein
MMKKLLLILPLFLLLFVACVDENGKGLGADVPFLYVFISACIIGGIIGWIISFFVGSKRKSKMRSYGIKEEIFMGKYLAGFDGRQYETDNVYCNITDDKYIFITQTGKNIGEININSLTNIFLDDKSLVSQRLTATRLLTLGIFSLAAPKKKKHKEYCIVFEWDDNNAEKNNAVFEFSGMACQELSTAAFNKLKKYKPITTKKCPFCDETIKIKAKVCKHCQKELD